MLNRDNLYYIKTEFICKLFGHSCKTKESGYDVCNRCGAHGYWHCEMFKGSWYFWTISIISLLFFVYNHVRRFVKYRSFYYLWPSLYIKINNLYKKNVEKEIDENPLDEIPF